MDASQAAPPVPFPSLPLNLVAKCHKQSWYYSIGLTIALGFNQIQNQLSNLLHLPSQVGEQESARESERERDGCRGCRFVDLFALSMGHKIFMDQTNAQHTQAAPIRLSACLVVILHKLKVS